MTGFGDAKVADQNSPAGKRAMIVAAAKKLAISNAKSTYLLGGKTKTAFDCSYFVYLVLNEVFPDYRYLSSAQIISANEFQEAPRPTEGDIIYFPPGKVPHEVAKGNQREFAGHVGIVLNGISWVGRQKGSLDMVLNSNPWWGSRTVKYYTYLRIFH